MMYEFMQMKLPSDADKTLIDADMGSSDAYLV